VLSSFQLVCNTYKNTTFLFYPSNKITVCSLQFQTAQAMLLSTCLEYKNTANSEENHNCCSCMHRPTGATRALMKEYNDIEQGALIYHHIIMQHCKSLPDLRKILNFEKPKEAYGIPHLSTQHFLKSLLFEKKQHPRIRAA
jgi:hypothetical protein